MNNAIQNNILSILSMLKVSNEDYCDIETIDSGSNIVLKDGSLMTFFKYEGMMSLMTPNEFFHYVDYISGQIGNFMSKPGYKIGVLFRKDLDSYTLLEKTEAIQKSVANRVGLNLEDLIEENIEIYKNGVYNEEVWFVAITKPTTLDKIEAEVVAQEMTSFHTPAIKNAQNIFTPLDVLRAKHQTFVSKFAACLSNKTYQTKATVVNVLEALNFIRRQFVPNYTSKKWMPSVVVGKDTASFLGFKNYRTPITWPINKNPHDLSHLIPPNISRQIMGGHSINVFGDKERLPQHTVSIGDRLYCGVMMDIAPNQPSIFNELFAAFNKNVTEDLSGRKVAMPWSISFMLSSDGMAGIQIKKVLSSFMKSIGPYHNKNLAYAVEQLEYLRRNNTPIVSLQMSAMTWVEDTPEQRRLLRERQGRLRSTLENWGGLTTKDNVGDPIMLQKSNILGLGQDHVGTRAALPLSDAIQLLPLSRPATPFANGTILHKTIDGKLMTLEKFSSQQTTWVTVITGVPGSGKSVLMNKLLFESCLMPGINRLPYISIIDKGISSQGLIHLLRDRLPPEKRHLVTTRRLRRDRSGAINPFDIKPGLVRPLESEKTQMVNFLTTLMTPPESRLTYNGTINFCSEIIDIAFEKIQEIGPHANPKMYRANINKELDSILQEFLVIEYAEVKHIDEYGRKHISKNFNEILEEVSYFALVRKLHAMGEKAANSYSKDRLWRGRDLAQRYAVPTLDDFIPIIESDTIKNSYQNRIGDTDELMPQYAIRCIRSIKSNYECFSYPTEFDVDSSRVMALDLQDVIDKNNPMQTALFFQVARMVAVKKFSLSVEDVNEEKIPKLFLPYYREQLKNLTLDRKILAYDEFHNAKEDLATMKIVSVDAREGRKWGVELILASQYLRDYVYGNPESAEVDLIGFATTICVCSEPTDVDLTIFKKSITSHTGVLNSLGRIGISEHGLTYFTHFRTKEGKFSNYITNQVGYRLMWSLTTDAIDRSMRETMLSKIPNMKKAFLILAQNFGGSVVSRFKERSASLGENITEQQKDSLISMMADEAVRASSYYYKEEGK